jgi:hypothetical protein
MTKAERREAGEVLKRVVERITRARWLLRVGIGNAWWARCLYSS